MIIASLILVCAGLYTACGAVFGLLFVTVGVAKVDHAAEQAPWSFRVMILPGAAALWPLLLAKWVHAGRGDEESKP